MVVVRGSGRVDRCRLGDGALAGRRDVRPLPAQHGAGRASVVHVHGFAISGEYLMPTARRLARRWVNVVPDLPGYGRSERRDHVLGIPALAEALVAILDALDIDQAVLVGNSMGCPDQSRGGAHGA